MANTTQTFNISFPRALVKEIDEIAEKQFGSRSDFLRTAALEYIRREKAWEYIFNESKEIGAKDEQYTEEAVAGLITKQRRGRRQQAR